MLHDFTVSGTRLRLWQRVGESYGHVLMKALGYAMFVGEFPDLGVETDVGLKYKPDLIAVGDGLQFRFWGECGQVSVRKTNWLLKHTRTERLVLFKIGVDAEQLAVQLRREIPERYRPEQRLSVVSFCREISDLTAERQIERVSADWYTEAIV